SKPFPFFLPAVIEHVLGHEFFPVQSIPPWGLHRLLGLPLDRSLLHEGETSLLTASPFQHWNSRSEARLAQHQWSPLDHRCSGRRFCCDRSGKLKACGAVERAVFPLGTLAAACYKKHVQIGE